MAMCDYRLCDVCEDKAFNDTNITDSRYCATWDPSEDVDPVGLAVLCADCAKTHHCAVLTPAELAAVEAMRAGTHFVVPVDPTEAMLDEAEEYCSGGVAYEVYRAMLREAPAPPGEGGGDE